MDFGKLFILIGAAFLLIGVAYSFGFRGLPGDIAVQKKNFTFFFPLATSIVLSLLLSLLLYLFRR